MGQLFHNFLLFGTLSLGLDIFDNFGAGMSASFWAQWSGLGSGRVKEGLGCGSLRVAGSQN